MKRALFTLIAAMEYNPGICITGWSFRKMTVSKKQQASVTKYVKEHYDRISLTVPQGKRAQIKAHADTQGESVNGFINRAIDETLERDKKKRKG